ncbi:hypothetical protein AKJ09_06986 [Labilithrix luteola]|uniref:Uncharacterized protein n=1 Tax=Labilithrix luteola TaxID=1391654 RepID=A0A0K1Q3K8_9BACT|nr:hypothetical protein [Labilithrix luteola]AKV00323.1 hypothetical protein AKJ09_06986 [Labilithrix luteola]
MGSSLSLALAVALGVGCGSESRDTFPETTDGGDLDNADSSSPPLVNPDPDASTKDGADPAHPCHVDLSNSTTFGADALADAIMAIRRSALGCVYELPQPPAGQSIRQDEVNVVVTIDGTQHVIPKRQSKSDTCETDLCWDYDADGKVALIGNACTSVSNAAHAKVDVYAGCATIVK